MFKKFKSLFIAVLLLLMSASPALALTGYYDYWATVYKLTNTNYGTDNLTAVTTGVTFQVLGASSNTASTLYVYGKDSLTSLTNPITTTYYATVGTCDGMVKFRGTSSTYDVIVTDTAGGYTAVMKAFSPYMHKIVIDERINVLHHGIIPYNMATASAVATGITFPINTFIQDVRVEVIDVGTAATTLAVGTTGTAAAFRTGVLLSTAGFIADTGVITNGTSAGDYTPASTYGSYLYTAITGSDVLLVGLGGRSYIGYITTGATGLTYTASSADGASKGGYIHYWFSVLR
jgi:hypothetical protein